MSGISDFIQPQFPPSRLQEGVPNWIRFVDTSNAEIITGIASDQTTGTSVICGTLASASLTTKFELGALGGSIRPGTLVKPSGAGSFVIKYDRNGDWEWGRAAIGPSFQRVALDNPGNVYVLTQLAGTNISVNIGQHGIGGVNASFIMTKSGSRGNGPGLIKYNKFGTPEWTRIIDGSGSEVPRGLATDRQGNVYVAVDICSSFINLYDNAVGGLTTGPPLILERQGQGTAGALIKYNGNGIPQWIRMVDGSGTDLINEVDIRGDSIYIAGNTSSSRIELGHMAKGGTINNLIIDRGTGTTGAGFVVKYDLRGEIQWGRLIDGTGTENSVSITVDTQDAAIVTSQNSSSTMNLNLGAVGGVLPGITAIRPSGVGSTGPVLIKYRGNGSVEWVRYAHGTTTNTGVRVASDRANNVYFCGTVGATSLSTNLYAGAIGGNTTGGPFLMTKTASLNNGAFLIKYDPSGAPVWSRIIDGLGSDTAVFVSIGQRGNMFLAATVDATSTEINLAENAVGGTRDYVAIARKPSVNTGAIFINWRSIMNFKDPIVLRFAPGNSAASFRISSGFRLVL